LFAVYHVFSYLKCSKYSCLVIDASYPDIDKCIIVNHNWNEFYDDVQEVIPPNSPPPRGKDVDFRMYVVSLTMLETSEIREQGLDSLYT